MVLTGSNAWALTEAGGVLAGRRGRIQKQPAARSHRDGASRKAMEEHCDPSQPDIHREGVGISNQVVTRHVDYLRDAFLLRACPQRLDPTVLTEMQIGMAARRRMLVDRPTAGDDDFLFYSRTPARKEIGYVSADLGDVAVEAKYINRGSWRSEAATVSASEWAGVLVTKKHTRHGRRGHRVCGTGRNSYLLPERMTARTLQFRCSRGVRLSTLGRDQFAISPES